MKLYVGQTRSRKLIAELMSLGIGEVVQPDEFPPKRSPWIFDNGAFKNWKADEPFDQWTFLETLDKISRFINSPDFIVVPDKVAAGKESVEFSMRWGPMIQGLAPLFVAIQDGMDEDDLRLFGGSAWVDGFFIGGTNDWKISNGYNIAEFARSIGLPCHAGRMGTEKKIRLARRWGVDSVDSSWPLWSRDNLDKTLRGWKDPMLPLTTEGD